VDVGRAIGSGLVLLAFCVIVILINIRGSRDMKEVAFSANASDPDEQAEP